MATMQKFIRVGSSVAAVIPKRLLGARGAGVPISVERGKLANTFVVRVFPRKTPQLSPSERRTLAITDAFINRYRADLNRLKDA